MSEQPSQANTCPQCGQDLKGAWVCGQCGHMGTAYFVAGAVMAMIGLAVAIVTTIALLPARSGGRIAAVAGADLVCGGVGLITLFVVLSEVRKGVQLLRHLGDRASNQAMRKTVGWVIGLSVVVIAAAVLLGLQLRGRVAQPLASPAQPAPQALSRDTIAIMIGLGFVIPGIILAASAFKKKRRGWGAVMLTVVFVGGGALSTLSGSSFDPNIAGRRPGKAVEIGTPVSIEDLTLVVQRTSSSIQISETRIATNARKIHILVQVTCDLEPGETCSLHSYKWAVDGLSFSPSLRASKRIGEIGGGETVEIDLSTGFILNNTSFKGAMLEFSMLEHPWSLWRSAYINLSSDR